MTLILLNFAGAAVFSAVFMDHSKMDHKDCVASALTGIPCPTSINEIFSHHIAVLQIFSVPLPLVSPAAFLLFALIVFPIILFGARQSSLVKNKLARLRIKFSDLSNSSPQPGLIRWLACHENSPSVL